MNMLKQNRIMEHKIQRFFTHINIISYSEDKIIYNLPALKNYVD
jgi:hypothetical protein